MVRIKEGLADMSSDFSSKTIVIVEIDCIAEGNHHGGHVLALDADPLDIVSGVLRLDSLALGGEKSSEVVFAIKVAEDSHSTLR